MELRYTVHDDGGACSRAVQRAGHYISIPIRGRDAFCVDRSSPAARGHTSIPRPDASRRSDHRNCAATALSRPDTGSSSRRMRGVASNSLPMLHLRCSPPDRYRMVQFAIVVRDKSSIISSTNSSLAATVQFLGCLSKLANTRCSFTVRLSRNTPFWGTYPISRRDTELKCFPATNTDKGRKRSGSDSRMMCPYPRYTPSLPDPEE